MQYVKADRAKDLYEVLEVSPTAGLEVIQAAYKALARRWHPDVNKSFEASDRIRELNAAYQVLRDTRQRATYDLQRARLRRRQRLIDIPEQAQQQREQMAPIGRAGRVVPLSLRQFSTKPLPTLAEERLPTLTPPVLVALAVVTVVVTAVMLLIGLGIALSDGSPTVGGSILPVHDREPVFEIWSN